jgi:nucleotide-binding universal stress UspA family protein
MLLAVDLGDGAEHVARTAGLFAARAGAEVDVLHAGAAAQDPAWVRGRMAAVVRAAGVPVSRSLFLEGEPAAVIGSCASAYDIVAMGTHPAGGAARALVGSVAAEVSAQSDASVLVVPLAGARPDADDPLRVLVPVDLTLRGERAVGGVLTLLRPDRVDLAHVVDDVDAASESSSVPPEQVRASVLGAVRALRQMMDRVSVSACGLYVEVAADGMAGPAILSLAERLDVDAIAMPPRQLGPVMRALLGSTTRHVVMHAQVPVLVLRETERVGQERRASA